MSTTPQNRDESRGRNGTDRWEPGAASVAEVDAAPEPAAVKRVPRLSPRSSRATSAALKTPTRWTWNRPLLAGSLAAAVLGGALMVGLYHWQSVRVGDQLRQLADGAKADQNPTLEVQWLSRYLALRPADVDAQIRLAWAFDGVASKPAEIDQSRRYLSRAIAALEGDQENETRDALRRRLIDRMLELGSGWHIEAERQIVLLNAPPRDPQALAQLAKCRLAEVGSGDPPTAAPASDLGPDDHFWKWAAAQPVGEVVRMAAEANPESTELAGNLVSVYLDRPELFDSASGTPDHSRFTAQAASVLEQLSKREHDGHAQWLVYQYGSRPEALITPQPLAALASAALERLQRHAVSFVSTESEAAASEPSPRETSSPERTTPPPASASEQDYEPWWDAALVLQQAASLAQEAELKRAHELYEALTALPDRLLPENQAEVAFWGLGQMRWELGEHQQAEEAWKTGNEKLGGKSLLLLDPLAAVSAQSAPLEEAKKVVAELADAAEKVSLQLARARRHNSERSELQARVNAANWRVEVLRGQIDAREGDVRSAMTRLERALGSQLAIGPAQRIEAAELLAEIYGAENLWDLAGRVLDQAVLQRPQDRNLRMRAAEAWQRASVPSRAAAQLQHADDGSFEAGVAFAQTLAANALRQAPAVRDLRPVRAAIAEADRRLEQRVQEGTPPSTAWQHGLLKLAIPPARLTGGGDPAIDSMPPAEQMADKLAGVKMQLIDLSLQYPQAAELQATVAFTLQRLGDAEAADEAVDRLETISDVGPLPVLEARARLMAMRGTTPKAVEELLQFAANRPEHRLQLTKLAAALLNSAGKRKEALDLLFQLDPDERDRATLMQLGDWLLESEILSDSSASSESQTDQLAKLQELERQLRATEGEQGTAWRWLTASRLLRQAAGTYEPLPLLTEAARLQAEIVARRPRWSRGLALGGRIAVAQGNSQQAVDLLRRAIAEGDQDVETVLLLVRQLNRIGDAAAAEQELARLEHLPDSTGYVSAMSVGLALGTGNYKRASERARAAVETRPNDADALLILAQTVFLAAKADPQQTEPLQAEAVAALNRAIELTKGASLSVWDAQFRFTLMTEGAVAARKVLEAIEGSSLPEESRWLAVARGYLSLGDLQAARPRLEKAEQVSPSDVDVHLAIADLHRAARDTEGMLESLETAHRLAPEREDISNRLAFALVVSNPTDVPWGRVSQLIGTDRSDASQRSQLYHALLLITGGGDPQVGQANDQLRQLMRSDDQAVAEDATRILATLERRRWISASDEPESEPATKALAECRRLYDLLAQRDDPAPTDLYAYGDLLLRAKSIPEGARIADQLSSIAAASRVALDLRLRVEQQRGNGDQVASLVQKWLAEPVNQNSPTAKATAGLTLAKLGFHEQAIALLEQAYQEEPDVFPKYIAVLSQAGQLQRAADTCISQFRKERSPEPVALLADLVVKEGGDELLTAEAEHLLADGVTEFPNNIRVLESIGTLRLMQHQYPEAISFFTQAEKINPNSLLTLNNMAIALAEVPGREDEGMSRIERAIELYGRNPELLDTLGIVHLFCNRFAEAEATLREAYAASKDSRHQFHLLLALHAQKKMAEAQRLWSQLDPSELEASRLTSRERKQLEDVRQQLAKPSSPQVGATEGSQLQ